MPAGSRAAELECGDAKIGDAARVKTLRQRIEGGYRGSDGLALTFDLFSVTVSCKRVSHNTNWTVEERGANLVVKVQEGLIMLTQTTRGSLVGKGRVELSGQIPVGNHQEASVSEKIVGEEEARAYVQSTPFTDIDSLRRAELLGGGFAIPVHGTRTVTDYRKVLDGCAVEGLQRQN
jgi:hypothetical protein